MRDVFVAALARLAVENDRVMLLTGDLGFGVLDEFAQQFPRQYLNVGIAEQNMTGVATGLALGGRIVFTYSIANFPTLRCLEQIRNDAAYHKANVNIVAIGGGFSYGALGMSHHATEDIAILRALPDVVVCVPCDDWEAARCVQELANVPGTTYLRIDKMSAGDTSRPSEVFQLGTARCLREGADLTIICAGGIMRIVLQAADRARDEMGLHIRVLSMHTVKPIDVSAIRAAAVETGGILTVEEHTTYGGLGSAVAEVCMDTATFPQTFHRIGLGNGFSSTVGSQSYLQTVYGMDEPAIIAQILRMTRSAHVAV